MKFEISLMILIDRRVVVSLMRQGERKENERRFVSSKLIKYYKVFL